MLTFFQVLNAKYPINVEVMYKVCSIVGAIRRIVCFERNTVIQVILHYFNVDQKSVSCNFPGNGGV